MTLPLIPTTVIGSLPKPAWLTGEWYSVVERWNLSGAALKEAMDDATRLALADQEAAGIDIVCDGEQRRSTHYTHFIHQLGGVDCEKLKAKSMRGGKFTQEVPRITGPLTLASHQAVDDYRFLRRLTNRPIKMTLPGPVDDGRRDGGRLLRRRARARDGLRRRAQPGDPRARGRRLRHGAARRARLHAAAREAPRLGRRGDGPRVRRHERRALRARLLRLPRAARQQGVEARLRGDLPGAARGRRSTSTRSSSPSRSSRRSSSPACRARPSSSA